MKKYPGKRYLNFNDHSQNWLNTEYGEYVINGNILTMTRKNNRYEFEILSRGRMNADKTLDKQQYLQAHGHVR